MPLADLTEPEQAVVLECLKAAADGPFFPDWEFHTLFGLERVELRSVISDWPVDDPPQSDAYIAISNSLGNLLGYPHGCKERWAEYISVNPEQIETLLEKWRGPT